jgi:hypothetical protein
MKRLAIVTVITAVFATACATSPRATPGPSTTVTPGDTAVMDTTTPARPDTGTAAAQVTLGG